VRLQAKATNKGRFLLALDAILASGLVGSLLIVKQLLTRSVAPAHVIPAGTVLVIHLTHPLTSRTAQLGDRFQARLEAVKGAVGIPPGLSVEGECLASRKARRGQSAGYLRLVLSGLRDSRGHKLQIQTVTLSRWGDRVLGANTGLKALPRSTERDFGSQPPQQSQSPEAVVHPEERLSFALMEPVVLSGQRGHR
jgi:hypothetical protein